MRLRRRQGLLPGNLLGVIGSVLLGLLTALFSSFAALFPGSALFSRLHSGQVLFSGIHRLSVSCCAGLTAAEISSVVDLLEEAKSAWAQYFAKWITAYEAQGVPVWGVTVQNEVCGWGVDYDHLYICKLLQKTSDDS